MHTSEVTVKGGGVRARGEGRAALHGGAGRGAGESGGVPEESRVHTPALLVLVPCAWFKVFLNRVVGASQWCFKATRPYGCPVGASDGAAIRGYISASRARAAWRLFWVNGGAGGAQALRCRHLRSRCQRLPVPRRLGLHHRGVRHPLRLSDPRRPRAAGTRRRARSCTGARAA